VHGQAITHMVQRVGHRPLTVFAHSSEDANRVKRNLLAAIPQSMMRPGQAPWVTVKAISTIKPKRIKRARKEA
jgi:hypothetical protein